MHNYNIGLDIGTGSVGYSVTDASGKLLKGQKGKTMWGVRLFEQAEQASKCRTNRSARRRNIRRRTRIKKLREIMADMINKVDPNFFARLDDSFLNQGTSTLFNDEYYKDKQYFKNYKTIYHLREQLIESKEKADPRMIYLALAHMLKYRGHFLFEGQKFEAIDDIKSIMKALQKSIEEISGMSFEKKFFDEIPKILSTNSKRVVKREKIEEIIQTNNKDEKTYIKEVVRAILGYEFSVNILICNDNIIGSDGKAVKLTFSDENFDQMIEDILGDEVPEVIICLKQIYGWYMLQNILNGEKYISKAMVNKYKKHNEELAELKFLVHKYAESEYKTFFHDEERDKKVLSNYNNYIKGTTRLAFKTNDIPKNNLYNAIKDLFKNKEIEPEDQIALNAIYKEMENYEYLSKINEVENAYIPYQLNEIEMELILENQGKYYNELGKNAELILKILTSKIPYYVGPLNAYKGERGFAWMVKQKGKEHEKVYPWNYEDVVDIDTTAELFITRMTNYCTYLPNEKVLPKHSLLYEKYELLQELSQIKINDKHLSLCDRNNLIESKFKKQKKVTDKNLREWLAKERNANKTVASDYRITGYQKENEFASSLSSYITFSKIFGYIDSKNEKMIEQIIYWLTVYEERDIVERRIRATYPNMINDKQLGEILALKYKGWGRFSYKFLNGIKSDFGKTIIETLEDSDPRYRYLPNIMQIINRDEKIKKTIKENRKVYTGEEKLETVISELYTSPAVKRGITQSMKIIQEIIEIKGYEPENIFIEFAREDGEAVRTESRKSRINKALNKLKENFENEYDENVASELKDYGKRLDEEKVYLYFLQNGKSLYSGKTLDLGKLENYEVDHILPYSISDLDELDNKALVLKKENQEKGNKILNEVTFDGMSIEERIQYWKYLNKVGLLSDKKLEYLKKNNIEDILTRGFINRQLTETRQIIKNVTTLITDYYQNRINVVAIKAGLNSSIRKKYTYEGKNDDGYLDKRKDCHMFYKNRSLNDYHHAHDAFLTCLIGLYIQKAYPNWNAEINYNEYKKIYEDYYDKEKNNQKVRKYVFSAILSQFDKVKEDSNGVVIWDGENMLKYIKQALCYHDCFISRKLEEEKGAFFKVTIKRKSSDKLVQIKKGLRTEVYGGYTGVNNAFYTLVKYKKGKKYKMEIIGIPIHVKNEIKNGMYSLEKYVADQFENVTELQILREKILKYQKIETEDGYLFYLTGPKEAKNAKQLILGKNNVELNRIINYIETDKWHNISEEELKKEVDKLYNFLMNKMINQYGYLVKSANKKKSDEEAKDITNEKKFYGLELKDRIEIIKKLLIVLGDNGKRVKLEHGYIPNEIGRVGNFKINKKITFIDTSVTGMRERRKTFELEDNNNKKS